MRPPRVVVVGVHGEHLAWLWIGLHVMDLQPSSGHPENLSVAADGSKIVFDISLPDRAI